MFLSAKIKGLLSLFITDLQGDQVTCSLEDQEHQLTPATQLPVVLEQLAAPTTMETLCAGARLATPPTLTPSLGASLSVPGTLTVGWDSSAGLSGVSRNLTHVNQVRVDLEPGVQSTVLAMQFVNVRQGSFPNLTPLLDVVLSVSETLIARQDMFVRGRGVWSNQTLVYPLLVDLVQYVRLLDLAMLYADVSLASYQTLTQ